MNENWQEKETKHGRLVDHNGGRLRTREELESLPCPARTKTWTPVPHHVLVGELTRELDRRGIAVTAEEYVTHGPGDAKLFGVLDLKVPGLGRPDVSTGLGIRASNDKSMAVHAIAGGHVFVCTNMAFSGGDAVVLRQKHTGDLDLRSAIPAGVDRYLRANRAFEVEVDRMIETPLDDYEAAYHLMHAFMGDDPVLPLRLMPRVSQLYFADEEQRARFPERSMWSLHNSLTEAQKELPGKLQYEASLRVGRFFHGLVLGWHRSNQISVPSPVIDVPATVLA